MKAQLIQVCAVKAYQKGKIHGSKRGHSAKILEDF